MKLHEKNFSYSAVIAQTTQVDAQTEYSICVTPFCSTMLQTPPSLFLVFMITKITTGLISWESERLWATLQEWHCSSVCKFLRGKLYVTVCITIQLGNISLHVLMLCATTYFSENTYTSFVAAKTNNMISMQNTKCIS